MADPWGYGTYKNLMRARGLKYGTVKEYERSPLKAFETALSLKPGPLKREIDKTAAEVKKAQWLLK